MKLRQQLPVHSPVSFASLLAGMRACIFGGGDRARDKVKALIRDFYKTRDILLTDSGTSALTLAIRGACETKGRKLVALPAYCCYDVATAADGADVEVVLYDVIPDTLGPDHGSLNSALKHKPAAVVLVHLYGLPIDFDEILPLIAETDTIVIEDAAQGHGGSYRGRPRGSFGSLSILSFGRGKGVTGGTGGVLLANDEVGSSVFEHRTPRLPKGGRGLRSLVATAAQWCLGRPSLYWAPASIPFLRLGETIYKPPSIPTDMSDSAAASLARVWHLAMEEAQARRKSGADLIAMLADAQGVRQPSIPTESKAGFLRFPVVVNEERCGGFESTTAKRLGIMPGYPTALCDLGGFKGRVTKGEKVHGGARTLAARLFTLPTHSKLKRSDLGRIHRRVTAERAS